MSDSTLHIGTLASNNVNNIVNDTSKYDEYKEKVKELEKELQTRKDTFEKMTEPLVYVCDCYQKFNVVTGMPKSTFGDSFGYAMQKEISDYMQDFYAGKVSREDLDSYFEKCCTSMRTYRTGQHQTSGTNEADNTQIVNAIHSKDFKIGRINIYFFKGIITQKTVTDQKINSIIKNNVIWTDNKTVRSWFWGMLSVFGSIRCFL